MVYSCCKYIWQDLLLLLIFLFFYVKDTSLLEVELEETTSETKSPKG